MDALVLAGGFARRMWPLTKDRPKHLLPVAGRPMLSYVMDKVLEVDTLERTFISTNSRFEREFAGFVSDGDLEGRGVELFIEDAREEGEKLGSVGAMGLLFMEKKVEGPVLVVGGDNLMGFSLAGFVKSAQEKGWEAVACHDMGDMERAKLYGIVGVDGEGRVTQFVEKPQDPPTTLAASACYYLSENGVKAVHRYLEGGGNPDAMGHFMAWLHKESPVLGYVFTDYWFDIGSLEGYREADEFFQKL